MNTETPSNRYKVTERFIGDFDSTVHNPTGTRRFIQTGQIIVFESVSPSGNVWFHDNDGERFKVESGSLQNMIGNRIRQMTFEEVNREAPNK